MTQKELTELNMHPLSRVFQARLTYEQLQTQANRSTVYSSSYYPGMNRFAGLLKFNESSQVPFNWEALKNVIPDGIMW
jgi:hypothetical protein